MRAWVLTTGDAGGEAMCLGVAEATCDRIERVGVSPRAPWRWLARFGALDPQEAARLSAARRKAGWPDVAIGTGAVAPYLDHLKRASLGSVATVALGPGAGAPDIRWILEGETGRGGTIVATPAQPHRINAVRLAAARGGSPLLAWELQAPRVGILAGDGPTPFGAEDAARLVSGLIRLREQGAILLARLGRNAPDELVMALSETAHYLWDRTSTDPYLKILAQSDTLVISADQERVLAEAISTGLPAMTLEPASTSRRARRLNRRLSELGVVRAFDGRLESYAYAPLDSTIEIARAIHALVATRAALRPASTRRTSARTRETNGPIAR